MPQLVADPDVDVVYVASPHSEHHAQALLAIEAGKGVLVEKAFTRNATEAAEVVAAARRAGVFAMEAMWTRFLPHIDVVRQCLEQGLLGEVCTVTADHGQQLYPDGPQRLADPALAGGALLDLGIYPMSFAHLVLGGFTSLTATGQLTDLGVDAQDAITVTSAAGGLGLLGTTMLAKTPTTASICGTAARLEIDGDFYGPRAVVRLVAPDGTELDRFVAADTAHGLHFQAAEVARRVSAGELESPLMALDETVAIMRAHGPGARPGRGPLPRRVSLELASDQGEVCREVGPMAAHPQRARVPRGLPVALSGRHLEPGLRVRLDDVGGRAAGMGRALDALDGAERGHPHLDAAPGRHGSELLERVPHGEGDHGAREWPPRTRATDAQRRRRRRGGHGGAAAYANRRMTD